MTNEIFGVDIAEIVHSTFTGNLHPATIHKASSTVDAYGVPVETFTDHAAEGVRDSFDARVIATRGWPAETVRIILLNTSTAEPTLSDHVTIMGARWRVLDVSQDPVNATWTLAGVKDNG